MKRLQDGARLFMMEYEATTAYEITASIPFVLKDDSMFLRILTVAVIVANVAICFAAEARAEKLPNIVFIMADDLGYGDLGCFGQKSIRTPRLDAMAEQGMRLTNMHAGAPLCLISRCTLMTGLHAGHARCRTNGGGGNHPMIEDEDITVAEVLKRAGYTTAMIGKWSLGDVFLGCAVKSKDKDGSGAIYRQGWDFYYGEPNQTTVHSYYLDRMYIYDPQGLTGNKTQPGRLEEIGYPGNSRDRKFYSHDLLIDESLAFIEAAADQPFFLYLPLTIPHPKLEVPEIEPYADETDWAKNGKIYASMVTRMDRDIGLIIDHLKKLGLAENTLVIFTSDDGGSCTYGPFDSNGGLPGKKGSFEDGGLKVPTIAYWPGKIKAGTSSDEPLAFYDVLPTFAQLAGVKPPQPIDGISFVPTLLGQGPQPSHRYLYFHMSGKGDRIIRSDAETRSDEEIRAEANTDVVVPRFED